MNALVVSGVILTILVSAQSSLAAESQVKIVQPETVQLETSRTDHGMLILTVGNQVHHYLLVCNPKASGCDAPEEGKDYWYITKDTNFKMPGATDYINLKFMQDWTVSYSDAENVGLISQDTTSKGGLSVYFLDKTGGYDQPVISTDGPIIYGTGLSDKDRKEAWKHLFLQMVSTCGQQQGTDTLKLKLAPRCSAPNGPCAITIDANLTGIGGIKELRKVFVVVLFEEGHPEKQLGRLVCTYPDQKVRVCRDWDTGTLVDYNAESP